MRKQNQRVIGVAIASIVASAMFIPAAKAVTSTYTFDYPTVTGSASPGTPTVANILPLGQFGQDNFSHIFAAGTYIRNDPKPGFTGNWISSYPVTPTDAPASDGIEARVNNATFSYHLENTGYAAFSADVLVGLGNVTSPGGVSSYRRSVVSPGVDLNGDNSLRANAANSQSAETAFQFGYESSTGIGWYIRGAAFGTSYPGTGTNIATGVTGTWTTKLLVDFAANGGDGAGTLLIKQLYDGNGGVVDDTFHLANVALSNVNLQLKRMNDTTLGGTPTATDPTTWNGFFARVANNGGIDNISFGSIAKVSTFVGSSGSYFVTTNWFAGVPNAVDAVGDLAGNGGTIYADAPVTIGTLSFSSAATQQLTGTGSLTLQTTATDAGLNVTAGSHKLNLPLTVASNTTVNVATGATLRISDPVTVQAGKSITQTGGGTLIYESTVNVLAGASIMIGSSQAMSALSLGTDATASLAGNATLVSLNSLSLSHGSSIDVGTSELRLPGSLDATRLALLDGSIRSTAGDARHGVGYEIAGDGKVRVLVTLNGDTNLDAAITPTDLASVAANYASTNATYTTGDFTFDGKVDAADLALLANNYAVSGYDGTILPAGASNAFRADWASALAVAPEPTTMALLGLPLVMAARRRRM